MNEKIQRAVELGLSPAGIARARAEAKTHLPGFPHNGCAEFLSSLLREAGLSDLPVIASAQKLADTLAARGWYRVAVGKQQAGDVAVCADQNRNGLSDHVFLVLEVAAPDVVRVIDNQSEKPHLRHPSGQGKTPVDYFLRAPS